jgi:hypothetical protein
MISYRYNRSRAAGASVMTSAIDALVMGLGLRAERAANRAAGRFAEKANKLEGREWTGEDYTPPTRDGGRRALAYRALGRMARGAYRRLGQLRLTALRVAKVPGW